MRAWLEGAFELVASDALLSELQRALSYPKLRKRIPESQVQELVDLLQRHGVLIDDPIESPNVRSPDPGDDYLIALGAASQAAIVSGDKHLLGLSEQLPIYSPIQFLDLLDRAS